MAKFPHKDDDQSGYEVNLWEAVALSLAGTSGIPVPDWRLENIAGKAVLIVRCFDRLGGRRIPFLSAMSMLEASGGEDHSYLEIADALRANGAATARDIHDLWRRIAFNVLISNVDDHLRNHGFLHSGPDGWRLSPAYDHNPVPTDIRPRELSTAIDFENRAASLDLAFGMADHFDLSGAEAKRIAHEVASAVGRWREVAGRLGAKSSEIDRMATAFEHEDLDLALGRTYGDLPYVRRDRRRRQAIQASWHLNRKHCSTTSVATSKPNEATPGTSRLPVASSRAA